MATSRNWSGWLAAIALTVLMVGVALLPGTTIANDAKDACKHGGWQTLTSDGATPFRNQGDCVSFAAHGNTPLLPGHIDFGPLGRESSNGCYHRALAVDVPPGVYTLTATRDNPDYSNSTPVTISSSNQPFDNQTFLVNFHDTATLTYTLTNGVQTYTNSITVPCLDPAS